MLLSVRDNPKAGLFLFHLSTCSFNLNHTFILLACFTCHIFILLCCFTCPAVKVLHDPDSWVLLFKFCLVYFWGVLGLLNLKCSLPFGASTPFSFQVHCCSHRYFVVQASQWPHCSLALKRDAFIMLLSPLLSHSLSQNIFVPSAARSTYFRIKLI